MTNHTWTGWKGSCLTGRTADLSVQVHRQSSDGRRCCGRPSSGRRHPAERGAAPWPGYLSTPGQQSCRRCRLSLQQVPHHSETCIRCCSQWRAGEGWAGGPPADLGQGHVVSAWLVTWGLARRLECSSVAAPRGPGTRLPAYCDPHRSSAFARPTSASSPKLCNPFLNRPRSGCGPLKGAPCRLS